MLTIDAKRLDLAAEYKANPVGPHSAELQRVIKLLRNPPATNRYIAAQIERDGPWYLAKTTGLKGSPIEIYNQCAFDTERQANWTVFRKRWALATGDWIILDDDDGPDPSTQESIASTDLVTRPLLGYASEISVANGEHIDFKVSDTLNGEYQAELVRIRSGDHQLVGRKQTPIASAINGHYPASIKNIHAGSYLDIAPSSAFNCPSFTLQILVWPTLIGKERQAIMGNWDEDTQSGYGLMLDEAGALCLVLGDGTSTQTISTQLPLLERHWYRLTASVDSESGEAWVCQQPLTHYAHGDTHAQRAVRVTITPAVSESFRVAAWCQSNHALTHDGRVHPGGHFNGKLEAPCVWSHALSSADRTPACHGQWQTRDAHSLVACWDFGVDIPTINVSDTSAHNHPTTAVNLPTRAVKGHCWDGSDYRWLDNPAHYAAIHFHDDDLYDCGWPTDFSLTIDDDMPSGLYAIHLTHDDSEDWIPFVVRPPTGSARAPLALILPTASYWAYANRHGVITYPGREQSKGAFANIGDTDLFLHHHAEFGLSMYDEHSDGSGVCYSSRLRPVLSLRPGERLWQLPADTHIIDWLDAKQIDYDVITEDDLDKHGVELLAPYQCVMTGTHPEYPSMNMMDAYIDYQNQGGRFIYLGGNGFYWRVSYHPELPGVIEMRRAEDGIRAWIAEGGEYYHASTAELGGMWRRMGRAPQTIAGTGMTAQGFDFSCGYERTRASHDARAAFIFEGVGHDERIGEFGHIGGGAAGWEIDRADVTLGTPPHALVVAQASDFSANYHWMKEELHHTHSAITGETSALVHCDMVFYETANGGGVFSTSSIAWAGSLSHNDYDNNVSRITENVIQRFIDPTPL